MWTRLPAMLTRRPSLTIVRDSIKIPHGMAGHLILLLRSARVSREQRSCAPVVVVANTVSLTASSRRVDGLTTNRGWHSLTLTRVRNTSASLVIHTSECEMWYATCGITPRVNHVERSVNESRLAMKYPYNPRNPASLLSEIVPTP